MVSATAGLAALVEARARLRLGPHATAAVAVMLGLEPAGHRPEPLRIAPSAAPLPQFLRAPRTPVPTAAPSPPSPRRRPAVRRLAPVTREPWTAEGFGPPTDPLPTVTHAARLPRLPYLPLLPHASAHDVLDAVASTWQPTSTVDTRRSVAAIAAGQPICRLPMVRRPSLAAGLQVLVDYGEGMQPFRRDQRAVVAALGRLVGSPLDVRRFLDDPWEGTRAEPDGAWAPTYRFPPPGRPVLVLGALGRGALPRPELDWSWRRLATMLAARESAVAALVPLSRGAQGPWSGVDVVAWEPATWRRGVARLRARRSEVSG